MGIALAVENRPAVHHPVLAPDKDGNGDIIVPLFLPW